MPQCRYTLLPMFLLCLLLLLYYLYPEATPPQPYAAAGRSSHPAVSALLPPEHRGGGAVLVTGVAGFIGYHAALTLAAQWRGVVVGVDNFAPSSDTQLKRDRVYELSKSPGIHLYRGDICDKSFLSYLFDRFNFSRVVHLAAETGVRRSLNQPLPYLHNNVRCFVTLLDILKSYHHTTLVYASSSSVYGHHSPLPFKLSPIPHAPSNVYAATKLSNEHFASAYCTQHGLKAVGLRFFTVYGSWGRPDMAVFQFTKSLFQNKPLTLYNSTLEIRRDFTHVSDVVTGVLLALGYLPSVCGEVYNIGSGQMVSLRTLLQLLQTKLETTAKLVLQPLPLSDIPSTQAELSVSRLILGYQPQVTLSEGLDEFVRWFLEYQTQRKEREKEENIEIESVMGRNVWELNELKRAKTSKANSEYRQRLEGLRDKYRAFAKEIKRELPSDVCKKEFIYYRGVDSPGHTIIKARGYHGNAQLLKERCRLTEQCVAFNSLGEFKGHLKPRQDWTKLPESEGLFVADIDMCSSDLHDCSPGLHNCSCHNGFTKFGHNCIRNYVEGVMSEEEANFQLSDFFDQLNWEETTRGKDFVFFQGTDSPGGDYLLVKGVRSVEKLKEICLATQHCLAFNTNGLLKHSLRPPQKWVSYGNSNPHVGLYVLDVDYCTLDSELCPERSSCFRFSPGNYSCRCESPRETMSADFSCEKEQLATGAAEKRGQEPHTTAATKTPIHVILSCDQAGLPGVAAVLHSLTSHTREALQVHIVLTGVTEKQLHQFLHCYPPLPPTPRVSLYTVQLPPELLGGHVHVYSPVSEVGNLSSHANFARFFFHQLFPGLDKAIYLDTDTVVKGDIAELWRELSSSEELLLAAPRIKPTYGDFFSSRVKELFQNRYGEAFGRKESTFNAGVYGVNLGMWRRQHIHKEVLFWMEQQAREPLWRYGTQPLMLLACYRKWAKMDPLWNVEGLGWKEVLSSEVLDHAKLLHWSGKNKPWLLSGLHRDLWSAHAPVACSGHGSCVLANSSFTCQ